MMNKLFTFLFTMMLLIIGCSDDSNPVGGGINPEPELVGCEAATFYDWDSVEFESSLEGGSKTWLAFDLDETTLFSINLNQVGFHCAIFQECDGELGSPPPLYAFQTNGNGQEVGIVTAGTYYLEIVNTRPNRLDFTFGIQLADIVYGCVNDNALNYNSEANVDDGTCEFNDCSVDYYVADYDAMASELYGPLILDCDGNCGPDNWVGDGYCDNGTYGIYGIDGSVIPINFYCESINWDEGDCEAVPDECPADHVEDCNGVCAPTNWLGDGFCDDGSYQNQFGEDVFFNCEEFNNDNGDCDGQGRTTQIRPYPSNRILIGQ